VTSKVKVKVAMSSRTKSPRNTKIQIGRKVAHPMCNEAHQFEGQKVKVTRPITVSYLRNGKAYKLQNCYANGACYQLPRPAVKAYGFLHAGGRIPCRPHPPDTQLVEICAAKALRKDTKVIS